MTQREGRGGKDLFECGPVSRPGQAVDVARVGTEAGPSEEMGNCGEFIHPMDRTDRHMKFR